MLLSCPLTGDFPEPHFSRALFAFWSIRNISTHSGTPSLSLIKAKNEVSKNSKSGDVRYHGSEEGRMGWSKGEIKKTNLGCLILFTVFEYKADIATLRCLINGGMLINFSIFFPHPGAY